eukprot:jgi/Galph1/710/GphlegSOOS_G5569.1
MKGGSLSQKASLCILCATWLTISIGNLFLTKWLLSDLHIPENFLIFGQLLVSVVLGLCTNWIEKGQSSLSLLIPPKHGDYSLLSNSQLLKEVFLMSIFSTLIYFLKYIGLSRISLTLVVTLRCCSPLFQVAVQFLCFGDRFPAKVLLSLVPIICGLGMTSFAEASFTVEVQREESFSNRLVGSTASILATLVGVYHSLFAKSVLSKELSPIGLQTLQSFIGCILVLPLLLYNWTWFRYLCEPNTIFIILFKGVLSFLQLHFALKVLDKVSTVGFSIVGSIRRVTTCIFSVLFYYKNSIGYFHWLGILISLVGILIYDKYLAKPKKSVAEAVCWYCSAQRGGSDTKKMDNRVLTTVSSDNMLTCWENRQK